MIIDHQALDQFLTDAANHYERSAPTVTSYINDLYARMDTPEQVIYKEIVAILKLQEDGEWIHPNFAANEIYHLCEQIGIDTTGQAGF